MKLRNLVGSSLLLLSFAVLSYAKPTYSDLELSETSAMCMNCHDDMFESLEHSLHRITAPLDMASTIKIGCISCHDGWEEHVEDPSSENISTPAHLYYCWQVTLCSRCHISLHQSCPVSSDPHGRLEIGCTKCHSVHWNTNEYLVKDDMENYCVECHPGVATEFARRSAHPLETGNVRCVDCHILGKYEDHSLTVGLDWSCQRCHTDVSGPYPFEHPVVYAHLVEGIGCTECHRPHGSPNDRLLLQPGDGLCLQCHGTPPIHRTAHSGIAVGYACVDCHSDIHGSFDNSKLLDPALGAKMPFDCYQCHVLGD